MEAFIIIILIVAAAIQILMVIKFFQMASDIRFLRNEYIKIKPIHKVGEYAKAKGERIYNEGEKLFSLDLNKEVEIVGICENGKYSCKHYVSGYSYPVADYTQIDGDRLTELPKTEVQTEN